MFRRRRDRGQSTVEFALVLPVLALALFGIIEYGFVFWQYQQLSAATSEGARRAIVLADDPDAVTKTKTAVKDAAPNMTISDANITVTSTWVPGTTVEVKATVAVQDFVGLVPTPTSLTSTRKMRVA